MTNQQTTLIKKRLHHILWAHKENKLSHLALWLFAVLISTVQENGVPGLDPTLLDLPKKALRKAIFELVKNDYLILIKGRKKDPMVFHFVNQIEWEEEPGVIMMTIYHNPSPTRLHAD